MNRRFQGKSPHPGRGGKKTFHNKRRDGSSNYKTHCVRKNTFKDHGCKREQPVFDPMNRLKEKDVGITEYLSEHEGFNGIIKQRYADFHVNEIDCDGNIVTLTSIKLPELKVEQSDKKPDADEQLKSMISPDMFEKIKKLSSEPEGSDSSLEIDVTEMNKDGRRNLHKALQGLNGSFVSNTKQKEEKKFIVVSKPNAKAKRERRSEWPSAVYGGDYVHFILFKENSDTMSTVNFIASRLRIQPNMITYAGTKDRRAMTSQKMSIWHVEPKTLAELNSGLRGALLGNYSFATKGLKLGDLRGNRFRIVLRNITGSDEQIEHAMSSLSEKGFINYYGLQRFGSSVAVPTHAIGKALLLGDWKLAVELILKPREGEQNHSLAKARKIWWESRNAKSALEVLFNKEKIIEGKLLLGLSQCAANDYVTALEKIPRNTRLLYLHSYQSLVWNKVVSRRFKELGLKPMAGDLIFVNDAPEENEMPEILEDEECEITESENNSKNQNAVKTISDEDLVSVKIHDIVMPLPGHDVVYPQNVMKDWYEDFLKEDGLTSATLKQKVRKYSVSGAYRKMVIQPDKMSWKTMRYSDPCKTLELSDKEKMKNVEPPTDEPDGTYRALILDFCLPSSTYATMALREILKCDTSSEHQASLNNYHAQKTKSISTNSVKENAEKPSETNASFECTTSSTTKDSNSTNKSSETFSGSKTDEQLDLNQSDTKKCDVIDEKKDERNNMNVEDDEENEKNEEEMSMEDKCKTVGKESNDETDGKEQKENKHEITQNNADNEISGENLTRKRVLDDSCNAVEEKKMKLE